MAGVLLITGPIYLTIAAGYVSVRLGVFSQGDSRVFGSFAVNFALPAMIFNSLAERRLDEVLSASYLVGYLLGSLSVAVLSYLYATRWRHRGLADSACYAMGSASSNSAFIGFPILLLTVPAVAGAALALNAVVENLMFMPIFLFLAERGRDPDGAGYRAMAGALGRLLSRPLIVALLAGVVVSAFGLQLPSVVARTVTLFAQASSVLSLFFVGTILASVHLRRTIREVGILTVAKLVLHPAAVWLAIGLCAAVGLGHLDPALRLAAVVMASMPVMTMYPILAQRYDHEQTAAAALLVTTACSFLTINLLLWLLGRFVLPAHVLQHVVG